MTELIFAREKMLKLQSEDMWIDRLVRDLTERLNMELDEALQIVFNSEILDDYSYRDVYQSL